LGAEYSINEVAPPEVHTTVINNDWTTDNFFDGVYSGSDDGSESELKDIPRVLPFGSSANVVNSMLSPDTAVIPHNTSAIPEKELRTINTVE
jgi:hypothetical protein